MFYLALVGFALSTIGHILSTRRVIRAYKDENVRLRRLQHETFKCYVDELDKNCDLERRLSLASK